MGLLILMVMMHGIMVAFFGHFFLGPRHFTKQLSSFESRRLACTAQRSSRKHRRLQLDLHRICTEFEVWWKFDVLQGLLLAMTCNWPCQCDVCNVCKANWLSKAPKQDEVSKAGSIVLGGWSPSVTLRFPAMGWSWWMILMDDQKRDQNTHGFGHGWRSRLRIERWKMGKMVHGAILIHTEDRSHRNIHWWPACWQLWELFYLKLFRPWTWSHMSHAFRFLHIVLQEQPKPSRLATATDTAWTACGKGPSEIWLL